MEINRDLVNNCKIFVPKKDNNVFTWVTVMNSKNIEETANMSYAVSVHRDSVFMDYDLSITEGKEILVGLFQIPDNTWQGDVGDILPCIVDISEDYNNGSVVIYPCDFGIVAKDVDYLTLPSKLIPLSIIFEVNELNRHNGGYDYDMLNVMFNLGSSVMEFQFVGDHGDMIHLNQDGSIADLKQLYNVRILTEPGENLGSTIAVGTVDAGISNIGFGAELINASNIDHREINKSINDTIDVSNKIDELEERIEEIESDSINKYVSR